MAMRNGRRIPARVTIAVVALLATACSNGASSAGSPSVLTRPSSDGTLTIVSPTDGQMVQGTSVRVRTKLTGAHVVAASTTNIVPDEGHLHITVDGEIVAMNFGLSDELTRLTPGIHTLQVEFVASDHLPFDPRVIQQVTFEVKP